MTDLTFMNDLTSHIFGTTPRPANDPLREALLLSVGRASDFALPSCPAVISPLHRPCICKRTDLRDRLTVRRCRIAGQLEAMALERERLTEQGVLPQMGMAAFRRGELRLEAELRWHEEFEPQVAAAFARLGDQPGPVRDAGARPGSLVRIVRDTSALGGEAR
jgi:hypothetical protein